MSTQTINPDGLQANTPATYRRSELGHNNSFGGVIRSELIKLRSLRSNWILIITSILLFVGIAALSTWAFASFIDEISSAASTGDVPAEATGEGAFNYMASGGWQLAVLLLSSLAVINISSEFVTGAARTTFAATPRRWPVYWAKALIVALLTYVLSVVGILASAGIVEVIAQQYGYGQDFSSDAFQKALWWTPFAVMIIALMSYGIAAILRNSVGPIMIVVAVVFVLPVALSVFQSDITQNIVKWLPTSLATVVMDQSMGQIDVEFVPALIALIAWAVVPLVAGAILTQRRDI